MLPRTGRFRRSDRILHNAEYRRVSRAGRRLADREFVLLVAPRVSRVESTAPRLGITASRKVGNAIVRNRVKRNVREWFRRDRGRMAEGLDFVVIARKGSGDLAGREIRARLTQLLERSIATPGGRT
jgi:ribonuclease P protein component